MNRIRQIALLLLPLTVLLASLATAAEPRSTKPVEKNPERHTGFLADIKKMDGAIDLVFVGDSITDGWPSGGKAIWQKSFAPLKALNLGISGDRTEHVLWRMQNGELDGYKAKLFVIMIGTNNGNDSAPDVAAGIEAIVKEIKTKQPQARILLLGIFPRGEKPNPARAKNDEVNALVAKLDDGKTLKYLDIGDKFLDADKNISKDIMKDFLHPTAAGYDVWEKAIEAPIKQMLGA